MSVTVKTAGKVMTLSRNTIHSLNRLTDSSCSSEMSFVAYFQTRASNSADRMSDKAALKNDAYSTEHCDQWGTHTRKPEQQRFTMQSGVLTGISSMQRSAIIGRPLFERTDFGPAVCI